jgi:hypothetical protein
VPRSHRGGPGRYPDCPRFPGACDEAPPRARAAVRPEGWSS